MRYLAEPERGALSPGNRLVRHYRDDRNALRFMHRHLRASHFPSGQYRLIAWASDGTERFVGHLYKTA